jgi:hypothetical protein
MNARNDTVVFKFSFLEHSWIDEWDEPDAELLKRAKAARWIPAEDTNAVAGPPQTVDAFADEISAVIAEDMEMPEAATALVASMRAWLVADRLSFVRGDITGFEGNHNDTEILIEARPRGRANLPEARKSRRRAGKKAESPSAPKKRKGPR